MEKNLDKKKNPESVPKRKKIERRRRRVCIPITPRQHEYLLMVAEAMGTNESEAASAIFNRGFATLKRRPKT